MNWKMHGVTSLLLWLLAMAASSAGDNPGTTLHIKDIFIGRCYDYKQVKYKSLMPQVAAGCEELYNKFMTAFSFMAPCSVNIDNYKPFMEAARQLLPTDKALFWSGLKELAHEYASDGERYVTLEDTLIGYVVDGLVWCGQGSNPGMNYSRCPSWNDCPSEASEAFWGLASTTFASSAQSVVTVILNGSRSGRPAYAKDSFFGKYELPNLRKTIVTGVQVILTHSLDGPALETCTTGSLLELQKAVTDLGFTYTCVDDPQIILHLLCADDPNDRACRLVTSYIFPRYKKGPKPSVPASVVHNMKRDRFQPLQQGPTIG